MSRTYIGKKVIGIDKNSHGEWEVQLEGGITLHFYSDGIGKPVTDSYVSTKEDREAKAKKAG